MDECNLHSESEYVSVHIGNNTFIVEYNLICSSKITISDDLIIVCGCTVIYHNYHVIKFFLRKKDVLDWIAVMDDWIYVEQKEVMIGDKSWISFNSIILKGVTVGEGAVVGAESVVTKSLLPRIIVGGCPVRIICEIPEDER